MRTTRQLSITLPHKMAKMVESKVASGRYATESEVVRDGLRVLAERDEAVERWLRQEVVPAIEAMKADPSRRRTVAQVRATLAALHKRTVKRR